MFYYYILDHILITKHHWYPGEPSVSDGCVVLQRYPEGFYWRTVSCQQEHAFMCTKDVTGKIIQGGVQTEGIPEIGGNI